VIEYGPTLFPALLDQLDGELPLTYRRLCLFQLPGEGAAIVRVYEQDVELLLNSALALHAASAYAAFAYSVALALDDSRMVRLPLRRYDVEREHAKVCEALKEPAPWLPAIGLPVLLAAYQGPVLATIELPAKMARPDGFNARPEPAPGEVEAQGLLRASMGFGFGRGYGRVDPGSA
jgi:hypothetical protein